MRPYKVDYFTYLCCNLRHKMIFFNKKGGVTMAIKTANVNLRIEANIKKQAEDILDRLGIPRSVAIDMYYRQIITHNGIPFSLTLSAPVPSRNEMTDAQFNKMMAEGLRQANADESYDMDEVFDELERGLNE